MRMLETMIWMPKASCSG